MGSELDITHPPPKYNGTVLKLVCSVFSQSLKTTQVVKVLPTE